MQGDEVARQEVIRLLRGPVAQTFKKLMPEMANMADPYKAILSNPHALDRAIKIFESRRDAFAPLLVDDKGKLINDNATRLVCGRSVDEVIAMAVRSGMRSFADQYLTDSAKRLAPLGPGQDRSADEALRGGWITGVAKMFRQRKAQETKSSPAQAERFYKAIRDALDFAWQVQFFPIYVEIPPTLFEKLGTGLTRLDSIEKLQRMARLAGEDIDKAETVIKDPALAKEMLGHNPLAATAISQMTGDEFNAVSGSLAHLDPRKKWDVFANTLTALQLGRDKRISPADITALAEHLDILNEYAVRIIFDLKLGREQFAEFLETAATSLGRALFMALFGPIPFFGLDDTATLQRRSYVNFVETTLKGLVTAIQKLTAKFKYVAPEVVSECLALVCESRRDGIAAEIAKLTPALAGAR
jgi:hypothetical protein